MRERERARCSACSLSLLLAHSFSCVRPLEFNSFVFIHTLIGGYSSSVSVTCREYTLYENPMLIIIMFPMSCSLCRISHNRSCIYANFYLLISLRMPPVHRFNGILAGIIWYTAVKFFLPDSLSSFSFYLSSPHTHPQIRPRVWSYQDSCLWRQTSEEA